MSWQAPLAELVSARIGIVLRFEPTSDALRRFLALRVHELGLGDTGDYVRLLEQHGLEHDEWRALVSVITNGQTAFFRDRQQFELIGHVMQELAQGKNRPLSVWSAGCATGEEPYSLAVLSHLRKVDAQVLGSDINHEFLAVARTGIYGAWSLRRIEGGHKLEHLEHSEGRYRVMPHVRERVRFVQHNLLDPAFPRPLDGGRWDLILCRNVFIYFTDELARTLLDRFADGLAEDGWLFLGHSDGLGVESKRLRAESIAGRLGYRLRASSPAPVPAAPKPREALPSLLDWRSELTRGADEAPDPTGDPFARAGELIERGQLRAARTLLERLVDQEPKALGPLITLANVLLSCHEFEAASVAYDEAHQREPLLAEIHYFQAVLRRKTGQLEAAADACRRALFLDPEFWPAAFLHAGVLRLLGRMERSIAEHEHTLRLLSRDTELALRSHVAGMTALMPSAEQAREACRYHLRRTSGRRR